MLVYVSIYLYMLIHTTIYHYTFYGYNLKENNETENDEKEETDACEKWEEKYYNVERNKNKSRENGVEGEKGGVCGCG